MAKKNTTDQTEIPGTSKRTRTVAPKSATVIALQEQLSEAKKLDKLLRVIPTLSEWGVGQVNTALRARIAEIEAAKTA